MYAQILPYVGLASLFILGAFAAWQAFIIRALINTGKAYCNTAQDALRQLSIANKDISNLRAAIISERRRRPGRDMVTGKFKKRGA